MDRVVIQAFADQLTEELVDKLGEASRDGAQAAAQPGTNGTAPAKPPQLGEIGAVGTTVFSGVVSDPFETTVEFGEAGRWQTIRQMVYGDAKVYGAHQARMLPLRQAKWAVTPDHENDEIARALHEALFSQMRRPWREIVYDFTMAPRWGNAPLEMVWRFDEVTGRWVWDDWALRLPWTITEWDIDRRGRLRGVTQEFTNPETGAQETVGISIEKLLLFVHERIGADYRGTPMARFMWKHYRLKLGLEKIDAIALERNAMGVPKWMLPRVVGTGDEQKAEDIVENVRTHERGGVVVPFGHDFKVEGVTGTVREGVPSIRYHGEEISLVTLANFLDLGKTQSGARAVADPQLDLFQLVLLGDSIYDCDLINRCAARPFVDYNFGPQESYPEVMCSLLTNRNLERWLDAITKAKKAGTLGPWSPADENMVRKESALLEVDEAQRAKDEKKAADEAERVRQEQAQPDGGGESTSDTDDGGDA